MPETSNSRTGKSSRKVAAAGPSRDVAGKKKTARPEGSERSRSPETTSRSRHNVVDPRRKTDSGNVRSAVEDAGAVKSAASRQHDCGKRRELSANSFRIPERQVAPIRDLLNRAKGEKQAAVRPKDPPKSPREPSPKPRNPSKIDLDDARKKAAEAALSRLDHSSKNTGFTKESASGATADQLAVQSVLHVCPVVSPEILHSRDWRPKIITYLSELSRTEKELAAVLTIHTLNLNKDKVDECVQVLTTYLKNIMASPDEEKYRSIKITNKVFTEKVLPIKGAVDFLEAAGFKNQDKTDAEGAIVEVLYLPGSPDVNKLEMLVDAVRSAEPLLPQVYRDPMVLKPQEAEERVYLPDDFYDLTEKELTEMYKKNLQKLDEQSLLMTKAMREKEERKHLAKYKYTVLRVRFPDTVILQGTFGRLDSQKSIKEFVNSCLVKPFKYSLFSPITKSALLETNDDKTLLDLKLIPSVLLNFIPEDKDKFPKAYLRPDLLKKVKKM